MIENDRKRNLIVTLEEIIKPVGNIEWKQPSTSEEIYATDSENKCHIMISLIQSYACMHMYRHSK